MTKNKKYDISDDKLFKLQEIDNFANDLQNAMKKRLLNKLKKLFLYLTPSMILGIAFIIFKSPTLLALSIGGISLPALVKNIRDINENEKAFKDENYVVKDDCAEINEILSRDLTKSPRDFYTDEFKKFTTTPIPDERKKYLETLSKQKEERIENLKSKKALEIAVLDATMVSLEIFGMTLDVSEDDINGIFDLIYSYLQRKERVQEYYSIIDLIMRTVVQNAISKRQNAITLENFTASFNFLQRIDLISNFDDIDILFKEIKEFIKERQTVIEENEPTKESQCKIIEFKPLPPK